MAYVLDNTSNNPSNAVHAPVTQNSPISRSVLTTPDAAAVTINLHHVASPDLHNEHYFSFLPSYHSTGRAGEQPPSYDEVNDPNAPPPSYDSLFGRVREVRKSSNGSIDFIKKLFFYLLGKVGLLLIMGLTIIVPVSMLVMGAVFFSDCPAEPYIPIYLIVGGACGLLKQILNLKVRSAQARQADMEVPDSSYISSVQALLNSFLICWFIVGCFWVYRAFEPDYDSERGEQYCNYVLYSFAFWLLTSTYMFAGIVVLLLCFLSVALAGREC